MHNRWRSERPELPLAVLVFTRLLSRSGSVGGAAAGVVA
jgi:hypothetical protein